MPLRHPRAIPADRTSWRVRQRPMNPMGELRPESRMEIQIDEALDVRRHLEDSCFQTSWRTLYEACPWATAFQAPDWVTPWYRHFSGRYRPMLVTAFRDGELVGLLPLAWDEDRLLVAGDRQAEYQCWVAAEEDGEAFITAALGALAGRHPGVPLVMSYLPAGAPIGWLGNDAQGRRCVVESYSRNLLDVRDSDVVAAFVKSKKRLRTKMNKLKRSGEVEFRRLETREDLDRALDEIIPLFEFRQGAKNGATPFRSNPEKRAFFLDLVESGRLHATALTVDGQIVSAMMGGTGHGAVHLGEIVHSAFHHAYSLGMQHLLLLVQHLANEGLQVFDLTPGGDGYKDQVGNRIDTVHVLTVHGGRGAQVLDRSRQVLKDSVRALLERLPGGIDRWSSRGAGAAISADAERTADRPLYRLAPNAGPGAVGTKGGTVSSAGGAGTTGGAGSAESVKSTDGDTYSRDRIADLVRFTDVEDESDYQRHLAACSARVRAGSHVLSQADDAGLRSMAWTLQGPARTPDGQEVPEGAILVDGFVGEHREGVVDRSLLDAVLSTLPPDTTVYARLPSPCPDADRTLTTAGFLPTPHLA